MRLRPPVDDAERSRILALNRDHVPLVSEMDEARYAVLLEHGLRIEVLEADGEMAGFVATVGPGSGYDSENYRWFARRYPDFCYLDRVVVAEEHRRRGIADLAYAQVEERAGGHGRLLLEVNSVPPNQPSLAFHARRGFEPVGERDYPDGTQVRMLAKELPAEPR